MIHGFHGFFPGFLLDVGRLRRAPGDALLLVLQLLRPHAPLWPRHREVPHVAIRELQTKGWAGEVLGEKTTKNHCLDRNGSFDFFLREWSCIFSRKTQDIQSRSSETWRKNICKLNLQIYSENLKRSQTETVVRKKNLPFFFAGCGIKHSLLFKKNSYGPSCRKCRQNLSFWDEVVISDGEPIFSTRISRFWGFRRPRYLKISQVSQS